MRVVPKRNEANCWEMEESARAFVLKEKLLLSSSMDSSYSSHNFRACLLAVSDFGFKFLFGSQGRASACPL